MQRAGASTPTAPFTTYYKVYSSYTVAPTLFWPNPADKSATWSLRGVQGQHTPNSRGLQPGAPR